MKPTDRQLQKSMKDVTVKHSQAVLILFLHYKYTLEDKLHLSAVCIFLIYVLRCPRTDMSPNAFEVVGSKQSVSLLLF